MPIKLLCCVLAGAILGAALGYAGGDTVIGVLICAAVGAIGGWFWERSERRRVRQ